jgi:hypothetical protein
MIRSWRLNSNSGRETVCWKVREGPRSNHANAFVCDIHLTGQYFGATLGGDSSELRDYSLVLKGLAIGVAELERLATFLHTWLQLPLAEQGHHPPSFDCKVGGLFDQSLIMSLGERDDTISGGKPVVTFRYLTGCLKGELSFVTDQSCLLELSEGIRAVLATADPRTYAS